jgi:dethiobiotin synthetase
VIAERGLFVTGTGTEVGKSVVAAVIANTLRDAGERVAVFKPAVSGLDEEGETDPELLKRAAGSDQATADIAPYRYGPPVSPHLAAELAGEAVDPDRLRRAATEAAADADALVCEGVGGLMVPLTPDYLVRNFAADVELPLVVVATAGLGTINHTLLTVEAAWSAELEVAAVVLNLWPEEPGEMERSNLETIADLTGVEVHTLPRIDLADPVGWPRLELI